VEIDLVPFIHGVNPGRVAGSEQGHGARLIEIRQEAAGVQVGQIVGVGGLG
jgi:hypothetical protein